MAVETYGGGETYPSTPINRIDGFREAPEDVDSTGVGGTLEMMLATCRPSSSRQTLVPPVTVTEVIYHRHHVLPGLFRPDDAHRINGDYMNTVH